MFQVTHITRHFQFYLNFIKLFTQEEHCNYRYFKKQELQLPNLRTILLFMRVSKYHHQYNSSIIKRCYKILHSYSLINNIEPLLNKIKKM